MHGAPSHEGYLKTDTPTSEQSRAYPWIATVHAYYVRYLGLRSPYDTRKCAYQVSKGKEVGTYTYRLSHATIAPPTVNRTGEGGLGGRRGEATEGRSRPELGRRLNMCVHGQGRCNSYFSRLLEMVELHLEAYRSHPLGQLTRAILESQVRTRKQQRLGHVGSIEETGHVQRRVSCVTHESTASTAADLRCARLQTAAQRAETVTRARVARAAKR